MITNLITGLHTIPKAEMISSETIIEIGVATDMRISADPSTTEEMITTDSKTMNKEDTRDLGTLRLPVNSSNRWRTAKMSNRQAKEVGTKCCVPNALKTAILHRISHIHLLQTNWSRNRRQR